MFTAALFTIARAWKQSKYSSTGEWIKKMWYIYTMEYCCGCCLVTKLYPTFCDLMACRLLCPRDFPRKNTEVGSHFLLQGIFPEPEIETASPALQMDSLTLSHPGDPKDNISRVTSCKVLYNR